MANGRYRHLLVFLTVSLGIILVPWSAMNYFPLINISFDRDLGALSLDNIREPSESIFITAAPQDKHVFLTWSKYRIDQSSVYVIHWRPAIHWIPYASDQWNIILVEDQEHYAIENLTNGIEYEFYISLLWLSSIRSPVIKQTPRVRENCIGFFCTQVDAGQWLQLNSLDPLSLLCRGEPIKEWNINSPNCYYYTADFAWIFLLSRSIDSVFSPPPDRSLREIRKGLIQTLWPTKNPFLNPDDFPVFWTVINPPVIGKVIGFSSVNSYRIQYNQQLASRITIFKPSSEIAGYAIYHEGHGGSGVDIGSDVINWLLTSGMYVVSMDMPLNGENDDDITPGFSTHSHFVRLNNWVENPISQFLLPIKSIVDMIDIERRNDKNLKNVMMIGRSGGGWTTTIYGSVDPRIYASVSIAGQVPISLRVVENRDLGDYEQHDPSLFDLIGYEDLMKVTGRKGSLFIYNANDPCCFAVQEDSPIVEYLNLSAEKLKKNISIWIDKNNLEHSISQDGLEVLERFLQEIEFW
jgi:hypothetical protein